MGGQALGPGEALHRPFDDAVGDTELDDSGYVLKITAGELTKCGAAETPYGIAVTDTKNPLYDGSTKYSEYKVDPELSVVYDGVVDVKVAAKASRTTDIAIGDKVEVAAGGLVIHDTDGSGVVVGTAEEALLAADDPADGDGKILVRVHIPFV